MQDLIIGCATNYTWSTLKYWINSINRCGFVGKKVLILFNCDAITTLQVIKAGFDVIGFKQDDGGNLTYQSDLPVHVERFFHIYNLLKNEEFRYVITTDVKDVIFQKNPVDYLTRHLGEYRLLFSSESIRYKDEPWGNNNLYETFGDFFHNEDKENEIYNVGVLAGWANDMKDLAAMIYQMSTNRPIPIVDQSTFNFMVSKEPYKSTSIYSKSESGWACQLGTTLDPTKIDYFKPLLLEPSPKINKEGIVTTCSGEEYYIVHQYDRIPTLNKIIKEKYED